MKHWFKFLVFIYSVCKLDEGHNERDCSEDLQPLDEPSEISLS